MAPPPANVLALPPSAPDVISGDVVRGSEFLPLAVFTLVGDGIPHLDHLLSRVDQPQDISLEDTLHLVKPAPESMQRQESLAQALAALIDDSKERHDTNSDLAYFPYAFLAVCEEDWEQKGLLVVAIDCEHPHIVTGFRVRVDDVRSVCSTLQNDDDGAEVLKEQFEFSG